MTRRPLMLLLTGSVALTAAGALVFWTGTEGDKGSEEAVPLKCPLDFGTPRRQGAPEQATLAAAPTDSIAVLVCAQSEDPGRLRPMPLASLVEEDDVQKLVLALQSAPAVDPTVQMCPATVRARALVFLRPDGDQAYSFVLTGQCSFISDGSTRGALPSAVSEFVGVA